MNMCDTCNSDEAVLYHVHRLCDDKVTMVYILSELEDPDEYVDLMTLLQTADEDETFIFTVHTQGGSLATGIMLYQGILTCRAHVEVRLLGLVASAGIFLPLAADSVSVSIGCKVLIHTPSIETGSEGEVSDAALEVINDVNTLMMIELLGDILSAEELATLINEGELALHGYDFMYRLDK